MIVRLVVHSTICMKFSHEADVLVCNSRKGHVLNISPWCFNSRERNIIYVTKYTTV